VQIGSKPSSLICYSDVAAMVHGNRWPLSFLLAHTAIGTERSASVELSKLLGSVGCITAYLEKCSLPAAVQKSSCGNSGRKSKGPGRTQRNGKKRWGPGCVYLAQ
jgi:hypothetical protein